MTEFGGVDLPGNRRVDRATEWSSTAGRPGRPDSHLSDPVSGRTGACAWPVLDARRTRGCGPGHERGAALAGSGCPTAQTADAWTPVTALRQIAYYKDRAREDSPAGDGLPQRRRRRRALTDAQREKHGTANSWQSLPGIGPKTAKVIAQAWAGASPMPSSNCAQRQPISGAGRSAPRCAVTCTCTPTGPTAPRRSRR